MIPELAISATAAAVAYSPVAKVLVERACDATGALFEPWRRRRVTRVEIEREVALALVGQIKDTDIAALVNRAVVRAIVEFAMRQANTEAVLDKAAAYLNEDANPSGIDTEWLFNCLDRAGFVSNETMQDWWARLLAGETNKPGTYSKQAIATIANMDTSEAQTFEIFCRFICTYDGDEYPVILPTPGNLDALSDIYTEQGLSNGVINRLHELGLVISLIPPIGFPTVAKHRVKQAGKVAVAYSGSNLDLPCNEDECIVGIATFTTVGRELSALCERQPVPGFLDHIAEVWGNFTPHRSRE